MADDNQISSPIAGAKMVDKSGETKSITKKTAPDSKQIQESDLKIGTQSFDPEVFEATKALISRKVAQSDELKEKVRELNDSMKNILINDSKLVQLEEKHKESRVEVQKRKKDLNTSPESQSIRAKLTEMKEELRDVDDSLSNQLLNLYQMTGVQEFETPSGEVREFVVKARVKAKKKAK